MTCVIFRLFSWAMGRTGKKKRSPCSLKSEYQPCGYVPVQASDAGESAKTEPERKQPFHDRTAVCAFGSRAIPFVRKEAGSAFSPRPWTGYYDTHYRPPTRQMGWPTLGCNQQDPWKTSERLVSRKPARMVPECWGASSKYSMKRII